MEIDEEIKLNQTMKELGVIPIESNVEIESNKSQQKNNKNKPGPRMCDGFEVGSYGCGTCSLAPVGFCEKMPLLAKKS
jgi:hypothetical protein